MIAGIGKAVYLTNATRSLTSSLRPRRSSRKAMPIGRLCLRKAAAPAVLLWVCIANLRPELYAGLVAEVPFVDVITTMSDPSVPLTTLEYEEWGNPADKREYDYMLSYSPYDNVDKRLSRNLC